MPSIRDRTVTAYLFYQAAFAALTRWYGPQRVQALTTLTLAGGLPAPCSPRSPTCCCGTIPGAPPT